MGKGPAGHRTITMAGGKKISATQATIIAFVVGQSRGDVSSRGASTMATIRSFPTYASHLPQYKVLKRQKLTIKGQAVELTVKAVPSENILVEAMTTLSDVFSPSTLGFKDEMIEAAARLLLQQDVEPEFKEEYTLYCVKDYRGDPREFLTVADRIAALIKSENVELSSTEIHKTIDEASLQYGKDDWTIVDWDGAFIFDIDGNWQDTVDVLEVANVNLLRLRHLDHQLDHRMDAMSSLLTRVPKIKRLEVRKMMSELMRLRVQSVIEFEHAERDIQLTGDWYAGRLYALVSKKLHLDRWRQSIRQVLASLEGMSTMAADHFSVTTERRAEQVQQILWYIQLVGWFVLLFLEWRLLNR